MLFKNTEVSMGDLVSLRTVTAPFPEIRAVVIGVEDGMLEVFSTLTLPLGYTGKLTEAEVDGIEVLCLAEVAIPQESAGKGFCKGQYVSVCLEGTVDIGRVAAAFGGVIFVRREDGNLIEGGAGFFEEIPKWKMIDTKLMTMGPINKLMREARIAKGDVGKFYVMSKDGKSGQIMTYDKMFALEIDEIGGWYRIGQLDVSR